MPVTVDPSYTPPVTAEESCVITLGQLEDLLGADLSSDDAAPLAVEAACGIVRTVAEQYFNLVEDEAIVLDGTGTDALLLPERPVIVVTSVMLGEGAVTDYVLDDNGVLLRDWPGVWTAGRQNVSVTYSHGYAEIPGDIVAVALGIAKRFHLDATSAAAAGVESETLGAYSVRYSTSNSSSSGGAESLLTNNEKAILRLHKQSK